jgi:hypothetical protein
VRTRSEESFVRTTRERRTEAKLEYLAKKERTNLREMPGAEWLAEI